MSADNATPRRQATNFCRRRTHEDVWVPLGISGLIAGLSFAAATVPNFQHVLIVAGMVLAASAALLWIARRIRRTFRWRQEDREDAAYAAAARAAHRQQKRPAGVRR